MYLLHFLKQHDLLNKDLFDFHSEFTNNQIFVAYYPKHLSLQEYKDNVLSHVCNKAPSAIIFVNWNINLEISNTLTFYCQEEELLNYLKAKYNQKPKYIIGVTGSSGKSSTCFFIYQILKQLKYSVFLSCSIGIGTDLLSKNVLTTISYISLKRNLFYHKDCQYAVLEVSSAAIHQKRLGEILCDAGIYTTLSLDHIDYHKTFEAYSEQKLHFINKCVKTIKITNKDLNIADSIQIPNEHFNYDNDYFYINSYKLTHHNIFFDFHKLNLLFALTLVYYLDINLNNIDLSQIYLPAGRLEFIERYKSTDIFLDGAHTFDQVQNILNTMSTKFKRIIAVYGMSSHRIKTDYKVGEILGAYGLGIVTDDSPGSIDPAYIRSLLLSNHPNLIEIPDRFLAIKTAIKLAIKDQYDCILVLGKGSEVENVIKYKYYSIQYNEKVAIQEILNEIKDN